MSFTEMGMSLPGILFYKNGDDFEVESLTSVCFYFTANTKLDTYSYGIDLLFVSSM